MTDLSKKTFVTFSSSRYGTDVAAVTDAALATAGNSYLTFYNAGALGRCSACSVDLYNADTAGPKGIAKRAVKDTAKAAIGVDQAEVDRRAMVAPDREQGMGDLLEVVDVGEVSKKK